jgi:hypothetical protein
MLVGGTNELMLSLSVFYIRILSDFLKRRGDAVVKVL